uniref:ER membrane protein complex subunit 10 n=1 Tax=Timema californicum TaxID=61474 RepID=A0A7R9J8I4_TIMCA|nr:unnamed protein product [Timema californicum]
MLDKTGKDRKIGYQLETDHGGLLTISLRHALGQEPFVERGRITIQSINSQSVALQQSALSNADRDKLKALAEEDGLYRLEAVVRTHDSKETLFLTFVKACALVESRMSDVVTLSLSQDNNIIAVSLSTQPIAGCGSLVDQQHLKTFNTTVVFRHMETGPVPTYFTRPPDLFKAPLGSRVSPTPRDKSPTRPPDLFKAPLVFTCLPNSTQQESHTSSRSFQSSLRPDTATYVQKLEREREARERGDTKDNRSFLAKYWMYIVPVLIFVLLSGAANPEGAAGGGAR